MNLKLKLILFISSLVFMGCTSNSVKIKNVEKGKLNASVALEEIVSKRFILDSDTAPKPHYIQVFTDTTNTKYLTFLNTYNNAIYFYDYNSLAFIKKITYDKKGPDGILKPMGYHIKTMDSIYVYDGATISLLLTNGKGQILNKYSLKKNLDIKETNWTVMYPQYRSYTTMPIMMTSKEILFTGQFMQSIPKDIISNFKFTARLDLKTQQVSFLHGYPKELYGEDYNWEGGLYTEVYPELHPDGDKLIYSFPVSHDLYIAELNSESYTKVYGGSNFANTIQSIAKDPRKTSREAMLRHVIEQDEYAGIRYDKYRDVYYRIMRKGAENDAMALKEKPIVIIVMDKDFKYLGETTIGLWREWNYNNVFVTKEGLNIEYLDDNDVEEVAMTIKIFALKKL